MIIGLQMDYIKELDRLLGPDVWRENFPPEFQNLERLQDHGNGNESSLNDTENDPEQGPKLWNWFCHNTTAIKVQLDFDAWF